MVNINRKILIILLCLLAGCFDAQDSTNVRKTNSVTLEEAKSLFESKSTLDAINLLVDNISYHKNDYRLNYMLCMYIVSYIQGGGIQTDDINYDIAFGYCDTAINLSKGNPHLVIPYASILTDLEYHQKAVYYFYLVDWNDKVLKSKYRYMVLKFSNSLESLGEDEDALRILQKLYLNNLNDFEIFYYYLTHLVNIDNRRLVNKVLNESSIKFNKKQKMKVEKLLTKIDS